MPGNKTHWPSIIILIAFGISAAFLLLLFVSLTLTSVVNLFRSIGDPAGQMIAAFAYGFEILVLILCSWFVLQRAMGREQAGLSFKLPYAEWQIFAVLGVILLSILIGEAAAYTRITVLTWFVMPLLTILVIAPPIWLLFGIGTKGIDLGKRWHVFTILGLSMTIGPAVMLVLELVVLVGILVFSGIYIATQQPSLFNELVGLGKILEQETNPDRILNLMAPYLKKPVVIGMAIGYLALIVPLIEELFKPLAVWIFAGKLTSPAQGFAMGMLSGGAFALIESLNASGDGSVGWAAIVVIRAGTSLLHMTVSGLVGWGIASAFLEKRFSRFFAAYFTAVCIHGIWNACAAGTGLSVVGESVGKPEWLANFGPAFLCGMLVLGIGMLAVLIASNGKLQNSLRAEPLQETQAGASSDVNDIKSTPL